MEVCCSICCSWNCKMHHYGERYANGASFFLFFYDLRYQRQRLIHAATFQGHYRLNMYRTQAQVHMRLGKMWAMRPDGGTAARLSASIQKLINQINNSLCSPLTPGRLYGRGIWSELKTCVMFGEESDRKREDRFLEKRHHSASQWWSCNQVEFSFQLDTSSACQEFYKQACTLFMSTQHH